MEPHHRRALRLLPLLGLGLLGLCLGAFTGNVAGIVLSTISIAGWGVAVVAVLLPRDGDR